MAQRLRQEDYDVVVIGGGVAAAVSAARNGSRTLLVEAGPMIGGEMISGLRNIKNVLLAGRCFSATHEAHGSARVMGTCMAMGQAVGTAAALASSANQLEDVRTVPVGALRERLKEQGGVIDGTH